MEMGNLPAVIETHAVAVHQSDRFMPVMTMQLAVQRYDAMLNFTKQIMKEGKDYGAVPGVDKPSLLKPGAEKLCSFFGLTPAFSIVEKSEEWNADEPFFYYWYKAQLFRGGDLIGEGEGSCNSRESKYRYRWVGETQIPEGLNKPKLATRGGRTSEFEFAIEKAETSGKYGKPAAYWQAFKDAIAAKTATLINKSIKSGETRPAWEIDSTMYRVPNPDVCDQVNTIQKMAQKRALIAATLIACNASEYYTQDIEDMDVIDVTPIPVTQHHTTPINNAGPEKGNGSTPTGETRGPSSEEARNKVKSQSGPSMETGKQNPPTSAAGPRTAPAAAETVGSAGNGGAPPSPDGFASDLPAPVKDMWLRMGTKKEKIMDEVQSLRHSMHELVGEAALVEYANIVKQFGDPVAKVTYSRRVVLEMWKWIQATHAEQIRAAELAEGDQPMLIQMEQKTEATYGN